MTPPHTAKIRQALTLAFDDVTLKAFCLDYLPNVYDNFAEGMRKDQKITLLLDHSRRAPRGFEGLLEAVRQNYQGKQNKALTPLIEALEAHLKQLSEIEEIEEGAIDTPLKTLDPLPVHIRSAAARRMPPTRATAPRNEPPHHRTLCPLAQRFLPSQRLARYLCEAI